MMLEETTLAYKYYLIPQCKANVTKFKFLNLIVNNFIPAMIETPEKAY